MNYECKDFIGAFTDVYPEGFCNHLINEFERNNNEWGLTRKKSENAPSHIKKDMQIFVNGKNIPFNTFKEEPTFPIYWKGLEECFNIYAENFSFLKDKDLICRTFKMQKTESGGGYHIFHAEQGAGETCNNRALVYMLYLNTLPPESCGETEFLYQQTRIQPRQNTMLIWPAAFTHLHRGNAVYGNQAKYISTGWFHYE